MIQQNGTYYKNILSDAKSYIILNNRGKQKEQHEQKWGGGKM